MLSRTYEKLTRTNSADRDHRVPDVDRPNTLALLRNGYRTMRNRLVPGNEFSPSRDAGFTLTEILVVLIIIMAVSVVVLPGVVTALGDRQIGEAARLLQASLAGARDAAIHANAPRGIRLLPDPAFPVVRRTSGPLKGQIDPSAPLVCNRWVPIETAPDYSEGRLDYYSSTSNAYTWTAGTPPPYPGLQGSAPYHWYPVQGFNPTWTDSQGRFHNPNVLCVVEAPRNIGSAPNPPTSWFWNIRLGDKIRIGDSTASFTVVGPMTVHAGNGNPELFINDGLPGSVPGLTHTYPDGSTDPIEYMFLVNGLDDDNNGFADDGWDGVDNDRVFGIDNMDEWEHETWLPPPAAQRADKTYTIHRRPVPGAGTKDVALPSSVVIDLTTWSSTQDRSRLPVNLFTGAVDILLNPDGSIVPASIYGVPSAVGLNQTFLHFWLADRGDAGVIGTPKNSSRLVTLFGRTGKVSTLDPGELTTDPFLQAQQGVE